MDDDTICTELGCMTPAQVIQCAEASNTECWIAAKLVDADGEEVSFECCGGAGKKARFSLFKRGQSKPIDPADVPASLTWARRMV
jgi:hypothetical protein